MDIAEMISSLEDLESRLFALRHALGILNLDGVTAAPKGSSRPREKTVGILAGEEYRLRCGDDTRRLLEEMEAAGERLPDRERRQVHELKRDLSRTSCIPMAEYTEYARTVAAASDIWHESKEKSDFASFLPWLEKIVEMKRRFALYRDSGKDPYDTLLDGYEKGLSRSVLDPFFALLRERLVPLIRAIGEKPVPPHDQGVLAHRGPEAAHPGPDGLPWAGRKVLRRGRDRASLHRFLFPLGCAHHHPLPRG